MPAIDSMAKGGLDTPPPRHGPAGVLESDGHETALHLAEPQGWRRRGSSPGLSKIADIGKRPAYPAA